MDHFHSFFAGLANILPFTAAGQDPFIFMLIGIAIGFVVGILPGLGGATTLALMLPFIYKMDPTTAFAFLLGSNAVTATTGDITSILFGVPGEGITAATIVDGHPMAKKGEAGRALGAALMSSLVGAVFGAFALALAIPIVQPLVLSIGDRDEIYVNEREVTIGGLDAAVRLHAPELRHTDTLRSRKPDRAGTFTQALGIVGNTGNAGNTKRKDRRESRL